MSKKKPTFATENVGYSVNYALQHIFLFKNQLFYLTNMKVRASRV